MPGTPQKRARTDRWLEMAGDPATLRDLCVFVAEGHSLVEWTRAHDVRFGEVWAWLAAEPDRMATYQKALEARGEVLNEMVVRNLRQLADADYNAAYDEHQKLRPFNEWPEALRRAVLQLEYDDALVQKGKRIRRERAVSRVRFVDPARAAELLGKYRKLFVEQHQHSGKIALEDLVGGSMPAPTPPTGTGGKPA